MLKKILSGVTLMCVASLTHAATITLSDTVALQTTNFTTTLSFAQFDTNGGTRVLESVEFSIDGSILGDAQVESFDETATTLVTTVSAQLSLTDALNNVLVVTIPSVTNTFNATAYDGSIDFDGTSGISYLGLTASAFNSESYSDTATLDLFSGAGTSTFTFDASAISSVTGGGNIFSSFRTQAEGLVSVIYNYRDVSVSVSTPSHLALFCVGIVALAGLRRARKS